MNYQNLTTYQKIEYEAFCDDYLGVSFTYSENREPLYFDEQMRMYSFKTIYQSIRKFKLEKIMIKND